MTQETLRETLTDMLQDAPRSHTECSEALGRERKWLWRKMKGRRKVYKSDLYAVEHLLQCEEL